MAIVISDTNEGPVVNVAAWFGTTVMVLGVCSRIWSKYSVVQRWAVDDALIIFTMVRAPLRVTDLRVCSLFRRKVLGCTMTATITMTTVNGLGEPQSSLSSNQIIELQKVLCLAFSVIFHCALKVDV
jgi:hypothetical protein